MRLSCFPFSKSMTHCISKKFERFSARVPALLRQSDSVVRRLGYRRNFSLEFAVIVLAKVTPHGQVWVVVRFSSQMLQHMSKFLSGTILGKYTTGVAADPRSVPSLNDQSPPSLRAYQCSQTDTKPAGKHQRVHRSRGDQAILRCTFAIF